MILEIDRNRDESLLSQICSQIRHQILKGTLPQGYRLPSTRRLREDYGVSRNVFLEVFDQLIAEGFLETGKGQGTFVAPGIPTLRQENNHPKKERALTALPTRKWKVNFSVGTPDPSQFPLKEWGAALRQAVISYTADEMGYNFSSGYDPLKEELKKYLLKNKGMQIEKEQIFICAGSYQSLILGMTSLKFWSEKDAPVTVIENPSYRTLTEGLFQLGLDLHPVCTDSKGLNPENLAGIHDIVSVCVTPSNLFPSGAVYPVSRRMSLEHIASERDFFIMENDYEGDFRLRGTPVPSLYSLNEKRVLHTGTFSQILYPGIRIGYLVVPETLISFARKAFSFLGYQVPVAQQKALALFLANGTLNRHYRKMKRYYQGKQQIFLRTLEQTFGNSLHLNGADTGLYLSADINGILFNPHLQKKLEEAGILADYEYRHYWPPGSVREATGILLGYGSLSEEQMERGIKLLAKKLDQYQFSSAE